MRRIQLLCLVFVLALASTPTLGDSIAPSSNLWNKVLGDQFEFQKTVTIDQRANAQLDVFFLFDTTGTMSGLLDQAKASVAGPNGLIDQLAAAFGATSVAFGVGMYQDFPVLPYGIPDGTPGFDAYIPWELRLDITTSVDAAKTALGALPLNDASVPQDSAESQFYALSRAAAEVNWRPGSSRVLVWFGDAPGWDEALWAGHPGDVSEAGVIAALGSAGIIVEAVSVGQAFGPAIPGDERGINGGWTPGGIAPGVTLGPGQAWRISAATGGDLTSIPDPSDLNIAQFTQLILDTVGAGFDSYFEVGLDVSDAANKGFDITVEYKRPDQDDNAWSTDNPYTNPPDGWTRAATEEFVFDVRITVNAGGPDDMIYNFAIFGTLDGGRILTELDTLIVGDPQLPPGGEIPEPSTLALMGLGLLGVGLVVRRKRKTRK